MRRDQTGGTERARRRRRRIAWAAAALAPAALSMAAERGHYRDPALHGDRLVFVSEGDLWGATIAAVGEDGAEPAIVATRLTATPGRESSPRISADGKAIAFAREEAGNTDVYVMPIDGGAAQRLTYHPGADTPLAWTPDGSEVLFRSSRAHHADRDELWRVFSRGGMPRSFGVGECTSLSVSATGRRLAFTRLATESSGADVWVADLTAQTFTRVTASNATDGFPMWLAGRVFFLSDRTGRTNIFSDFTQGGDLKQHTRFGADDQDVRWPSAGTRRRDTRLVFSQGGSLALLDVLTDDVRQLDVRVITDRHAARPQLVPAAPTAGDLALSPDGRTLLVGARGEILAVDTRSGAVRQMTHSSGIRERGPGWLGSDQIVLVTDATGEGQIGVMPGDGSDLPSLATEDRDVWLYAPRGSANGRWIAFSDKTMRLHVIDLESLERHQADQGDAGPITDYRFSPDSQWVAYTRPAPSGGSAIRLYSLRTRRGHAVTDGASADRAPRWDPAGKYLYFLSSAIGDDAARTRIRAAPLAADTPPPTADAARAAGFDLEAWSVPAAAMPAEGDEEQFQRIDPESLRERHVALPGDASAIHDLEAQWGGVCHTTADGTLHRVDLAKGTKTVLTDAAPSFVISADGARVAFFANDGIRTASAREPGPSRRLDLSRVMLTVDVREEWTQILREAWRLCRDFAWRKTPDGVDGASVYERYAGRLSRVGTRDELDDLVAEMVDDFRVGRARPVDREATPAEAATGLLGAILEPDASGIRARTILPGGPLAEPALGIETGTAILAINGQPLPFNGNVYALLRGQAGRVVTLKVSDADGANVREISVRAIADESSLRRDAWTAANRASVHGQSDGRVGYVHLAATDGASLARFDRALSAQLDRSGLVVDIRGLRDTGRPERAAAFVLERLTGRVLALGQPRHGVSRRFPADAPRGHIVLLTGGDPGPADAVGAELLASAFRQRGLGRIIGDRVASPGVDLEVVTPFIDGSGLAIPTVAWRDASGWIAGRGGVKPDVPIALTPTDRRLGRDPQLASAVDAVLARITEDPREPPAAPPFP